MTTVSALLNLSHPVNTRVQTISPRATIFEALKIMKGKNIGCLPVLDEGIMVGIISERDLAFKVLFKREDPTTVLVTEFMTPYPRYVTPASDVMDCLNEMKELNVRHMPVLENGRLIGVVSMRDVLHTLLKNQELLSQQFESYILGNR